MTYTYIANENNKETRTGTDFNIEWKNKTCDTKSEQRRSVANMN